MHAPATPDGSSQPASTPSPTTPTEWLVLLQCAALHPNLNHFAEFMQPPFDWHLLLRLAEEHRIVPLLAMRTHNLNHVSVPEEVHGNLRELQRAQTLFTLQLTAELFRILARFASAGIEILVTKGPALAARCYGDPGMRQYRDLDLVVRQAHIRGATQIMIELGYDPRVPLTAIDAKKTPGEYSFAQSATGLLVEFHTERTFRYHPRPLDIEKLFQRRSSLIIDGRKVPVLSLEDELVLICVHGTKHFWERLLWIADVAALIARQPLDWDRALAVAREVGADRILHLGLRLPADLLGANLPPQIEARVRADRTGAKLAAQIESRLARPELHQIPILQRAAFRVRMRDSLFPGIGYLLRLSLSPTEEDWTAGKEGYRAAFIEAIGRPLRLARKHGRGSSK
jgi:hypothetical protein